MASNAKALSFLSGDLSLSGTEVSINVAGSVQSDSITGSTITMKNTGSTILASDGTTAVLSESSGTVTIDADVSTIGSATISGGSITGTEIDLKSSGTTIFASDGTTAVLSESGGTVTLTADEANVGSNALVVDSSGNVGIGASSPSSNLHVASTTSGTVIKAAASSATTSASYLILSGYRNAADHGVLGSVNFTNQNTTDTVVASIQGFKEGNSAIDLGYLSFRTKPTGGSLTERMQIDSSGNLLVGKSSADETTAGFNAAFNGTISAVRSGSVPCVLNRLSNDGDVLQFRQNGTTEGRITVSGTTVTYNGGHLGRFSQLADNTRDESIVKGTVMSNLDQMAEWTTDGVTEDNEQLNCMKVSDVEGDINVAGVFVNWDNDDDIYTNDMNIAMTGDMVIRIAQGTTVQRGDLLMSAGDGTAKPQGDDIVRSKTIAKVTSTHVSNTYDDGSYVVPCVLMAC